MIAEIGQNKIEFEQDKTVKVNGKKFELKPGINDVPGGKVEIIENVLFFQANVSGTVLF